MAKKKRECVPELKFHEKLVLNRYILRQFGAKDLRDLSQGLLSPELELLNEAGNTGFYGVLLGRLSGKMKVDALKLAEYDLNIVRALGKINYKRHDKIRLKYFQYLSLLFCEYYLDSYFNDPDGLLDGLNLFLHHFNYAYPRDAISKYELSDLNKVALWNATGSGKTLLMHINYHQYRHYAEAKVHAALDGIFMLLTPKEGLSNQHIEDFSESSIGAQIYAKDESQMFALADTIHVIENTKLGEVDGQKTVAVSRFGSSNVVFVDEGHRGASGDVWYKFRNELCKDGFSFEYSATFGQAVVGDAALVDEYAKCILFDYSYKYFYSDGYGKDYNIINLVDDVETHLRDVYLTACLVAYYQQKKLYIMGGAGFAEFNIDNPLFVFVGSRVNAVRSQNGGKVSDVVDIMLYFKDFVSERGKYANILESVKAGKTGIVGGSNEDIFYNAFFYLESLNLPPSELYDDILKVVFNNANSGSVLHVENLRGVSGEIRLRLGENDAFGVINVGDDVELLKLLAASGFDTASVDFSSSLFEGITRPNSTINLLIGSKKFTEGWNCWRVSTMGLMNVGRSEGSEIIQLFGRGVRLKGREISLKRSGALVKDGQGVEPPPFIQILETLNVFGIRADYMKQFKEYLEKEGVSAIRGKPVVIKLPTIKNLEYSEKGLYALKLRDGVDFKTDAPKPELSMNARIIGKIELDCYGKVQFETSSTKLGGEVTKEDGYLPKSCLAFLNYENIYVELVRYKNEKARYNLNVTMAGIVKLLKSRDWYKLLIPQRDAEFRSLSDIGRFEKMAIALLKSYSDKIYTTEKKNWEAPLLKYDKLHGKSAFERNNLVDEYTVTIASEQGNEEIIEFIERLREELINAQPNKKPWEQSGDKGGFEYIGFDNLLYSPFLYLAKGNTQIEVSPVALNESEKKFICDLRGHIKNNALGLGQDPEQEHLYLIRNKPKKGIGFFEDSGFYPDFILWRIVGGKQYITFIDPHGMRNESINSHKVRLYGDIKKIEKRLGDKNVVLNSVIISPTPKEEMADKRTKEQWSELGVFFQQDDNYIARMFNVLFSGG